MSRRSEPFNPFRYKVVINGHLIKVTMRYSFGGVKFKKEFCLLFDEWMKIKRFIGTPFNTHSMRYRLLIYHMDPLFSSKERLYPEYMQICMDAGKAIEKEIQRSATNAV